MFNINTILRDGVERDVDRKGERRKYYGNE
jgi:hypothetical protein